MTHVMQAQLEEFHRKVMNDEIPRVPTFPSDEERDLRISLMKEELVETIEAMQTRDWEGIADGLADLLYVVYGTAVRYGLNMAPIVDEVHRANMRKSDGPMREDGKRLKPPDWQPPNIRAVLDRLGCE